MPLPAWVPIATTAMSAIGNFIGGKRRADTARANTMRTIRANKEMAELEFQRNKQMWQMMKEYNTPKNQMARFKEAGLNPNLIYGQGTPGNVQQYPQYQRPNIEYRMEPDQGLPGAMNALGEFQGDIMDHRRIAGQELSNIGQEWSNNIKSLETLSKKRKNKLDALLHGELLKDPKKLVEILKKDWVAGMTAQEKQNTARDLKNFYQEEVNKLIEKGLTPGDSVYLRIGLSILDALGVETNNINIGQ